MPDILIIEDDASIRETIAEVLSDEGYTVATAADGAQGLDVLAHHLPDVVLLDMRMPVLDGWGFVRGLRERGITLPVVVMSAAQDARRWAQEVDAVGSIAKPFDLTDLLAVVARTIGSRP